MRIQQTHITFAKPSKRWFLGCIVLLLLLSSCQTTKFVPEGEYLLNKARVKVEGTKEVTSDDLSGYLRQKQNSEVFGFWKMQLNLYSLSSADTSKWINKQLRKIGEPPEIYSQMQTTNSMHQISKAMHNKGFFLATVDTITKAKKKKKEVTYLVRSEEPYSIRSYNIRFKQTVLQSIAGNRSLIHVGDRYDTELLDSERARISNRMRATGYYYFTEDLIHYVADSSLRQHKVDLTICLVKKIEQAPDSLKQKLFTQYKIRHVGFELDTLEREREPLSLKALRRNCYIKEGDIYNYYRVERTYEALNALPIVKYINIEFTRVSSDELDCHITLSRGKRHSVTAEVEGTYSAGDWGVGAGVGYINRNIFHGAEVLSVNAKGSYEWRQNGGRAIEAKLDASITFPKSLKLNTAFQFQLRPDEYVRVIADAGLTYSLHNPGSRWYHKFSLFDLGYVYLPWVSDDFKEYFLQNNNILKYSYEDHFIMSWGYQASYSSYRQHQPLRSYGNVTMSVETAGNLLYGISCLIDPPDPMAENYYELFGIRFSQYAKADIDLTYHQIFNKLNRLVYHGHLGVAVPYGNAAVIPFEKRYFSGGANSVRGWTMRSLGPGTYRGTGERIDFNNQSGDIKLDLNLEYRIKIFKYLEGAAFTDAGNVWTIRDYESQAGGVFDFREFYKQIAWSYGIGLRLNFNYFVFRVDFGVKLYDPSRISEGKQWRTVPNGLKWKDDMSLHFAIGYPF